MRLTPMKEASQKIKINMNKRVTRTIALQIAKRMVNDTISKKYLEKRTYFYDLLYNLAMAQLPDEVLLLNKTNPRFLRKCSQIRICKGTAVILSIWDSKEFPYSDGTLSIEPSEETCEEIMKLYNELKKLNNEESTVLCQLEECIYSMKTYKTIEKEFPEAFKLLPKEEEAVTAVSFPVKELLKKLKV